MVGLTGSLIGAFSDFKAFLYILIGGFSSKYIKGFKVREGLDNWES